MPSPRIRKYLNSEIYFLTFTVVDWVDIFTSEKYFELLLLSLSFHQENFGLCLFGYVFMTNHLHLMVQCEDMAGFVRSYKGYVTKGLKKLISEDNREYLKYFCNKGVKIFQAGNWPVLIYSEKFFYQKLNYIHNNPVKKGYVVRAEDWRYSSAGDSGSELCCAGSRLQWAGSKLQL